MRYRLVIFDFDGTLSDSFAWFTSTLNTVAGEFGFEKVEAHEIEALRRCRPRELMQHLRIPFWMAPLIAWRMRRLMARDIDGISLFEGVHGLLRELSSRGATLALVTSNSRRNVRTLLGPESSALIRLLECGTPMYGKGARLRRVLRQSGVPPGEAIYIGDELRDLGAARSAGVAFGAVSWGYGDVGALRASSPDEVFASLGEIADKLTGC